MSETLAGDWNNLLHLYHHYRGLQSGASSARSDSPSTPAGNVWSCSTTDMVSSQFCSLYCACQSCCYRWALVPQVGVGRLYSMELLWAWQVSPLPLHICIFYRLIKSHFLFCRAHLQCRACTSSVDLRWPVGHCGTHTQEGSVTVNLTASTGSKSYLRIR